MGPERSLNAFLREVADRPFEWGVWDCLIFTNEAFKRMHGVGWADDWMGRYIAPDGLLTRSQLRREYGHQNLEHALESRLTRSYGVPPRGALVVGGKDVVEAGYLGVGFGISVGTRAAFLSRGGVVYSGIEMIDSGWVRR